MIQNIEHIGIAVADEARAVQLFTRLLGREPYKSETVESEGVKTIFFQIGPTKIELLVALNPESTIARFIEKRGEGIHHLAFGVDDLEAELQRAEQAGFQTLQAEPRPGADNKRVGFLHPKGTNGVLVEFCEDRPQ